MEQYHTYQSERRRENVDIDSTRNMNWNRTRIYNENDSNNYMMSYNHPIEMNYNYSPEIGRNDIRSTNRNDYTKEIDDIIAQKAHKYITKGNEDYERRYYSYNRDCYGNNYEQLLKRRNYEEAAYFRGNASKDYPGNSERGKWENPIYKKEPPWNEDNRFKSSDNNHNNFNGLNVVDKAIKVEYLSNRVELTESLSKDNDNKSKWDKYDSEDKTWDNQINDKKQNELLHAVGADIPNNKEYNVNNNSEPLNKESKQTQTTKVKDEQIDKLIKENIKLQDELKAIKKQYENTAKSNTGNTVNNTKNNNNSNIQNDNNHIDYSNEALIKARKWEEENTKKVIYIEAWLEVINKELVKRGANTLEMKDLETHKDDIRTYLRDTWKKIRKDKAKPNNVMKKRKQESRKSITTTEKEKDPVIVNIKNTNRWDLEETEYLPANEYIIMDNKGRKPPSELSKNDNKSKYKSISITKVSKTPRNRKHTPIVYDIENDDRDKERSKPCYACLFGNCNNSRWFSTFMQSPNSRTISQKMLKKN